MSRPIKRAIYPGTFDPITNGHLDIVRRASALFDHVIIAVADYTSKTPLLPLSERLALVNQVVKKQKFKCPVTVETFRGLLVRFAEKKGATAVVRGLRAISDFEYEFQMALMNRHQSSTIETVFFMPDEKYVYLSSSMVKQIAHLGGDLKAFLPPPTIKALKNKFRI
jgi:pantetheine-phosphate adenylyltransferase